MGVLLAVNVALVGLVVVWTALAASERTAWICYQMTGGIWGHMFYSVSQASLLRQMSNSSPILCQLLNGTERSYTQMWGFPCSETAAELQVKHKSRFADSQYLGIAKFTRFGT